VAASFNCWAIESSCDDSGEHAGASDTNNNSTATRVLCIILVLDMLKKPNRIIHCTSRSEPKDFASWRIGEPHTSFSSPERQIKRLSALEDCLGTSS
jgi:hypothetical protein